MKKYSLKQIGVVLGSIIAFQTLHEIIYGLLGFRFFLENLLAEVFYTSLIVLFSFYIEGKLKRWLNRDVDWSENPLKRLVFQSSLVILLTGLIVTVVKILIGYLRIHTGDSLFISTQTLLIDFSILALVIQLRVLMEFGQYLLQKWNNSKIEMETFQKEKAQFSLELLRTQINPHFLFNNLNTLSALIYSDQDKAASFLRKLSGVYRSILEYRNKELIDLNEELQFFIQYKELLEIRFENMLFFRVNIEEGLGKKKLLPLTLQMLVENAIKHNVLSQKNPLTITIVSEGEYLWIENNYQPKENQEYSSQLGLKMIENRFSYLTKLPVIVEQTATHFLVKIPMLNEQ